MSDMTTISVYKKDRDLFNDLMYRRIINTSTKLNSHEFFNYILKKHIERCKNAKV